MYEAKSTAEKSPDMSNGNGLHNTVSSIAMTGRKQIEGKANSTFNGSTIQLGAFMFLYLSTRYYFHLSSNLLALETLSSKHDSEN